MWSVQRLVASMGSLMRLLHGGELCLQSDDVATRATMERMVVGSNALSVSISVYTWQLVGSNALVGIGFYASQLKLTAIGFTTLNLVKLMHNLVRLLHVGYLSTLDYYSQFQTPLFIFFQF